MVKREPTEVFPWAGFLTVWSLVVQLWTRATKLAVAGLQLALFSAALIALRDDGKLTHLLWTKPRLHRRLNPQVLSSSQKTVPRLFC